MSTDRDTTRIVRSWLRTDEHESADRVLDIVLARLDATPQRRSLWPARRIADMNAITRLAVAAAAVVVVAVVGYNLLPARGGIGGGPASATSPAPSATSSPTPSPSSTPRAFPAPGDLSIGRHSFTLEGVTFTLALTTPGWVSEGSFGLDKGPQSGHEAGFIFWANAPVGVYADPCAQIEAPPVAHSPAALAAALATVPGIDLVSGPTDVTVGGRPAKHVVVTIPNGIGCTPEAFYLWYTDVSCGDAATCGRYATEVDSTINVWIIDVDGAIVWIDGETYKESNPGAAQEVEQIVNSIQFE